MKVINMESTRGNKIANQFIVDGEHCGQKGKFFQSYNSVIAFIPANGASISLDKNKWDYSTTTGKYRNIFLRENKKATRAKIDSGVYILVDLN